MNTEKSKHVSHNSERGQSLVELAVSFMLIMFILAGTVDIGRAYFTYISMRDAVQEGVIFASAYPDEIENIENRVKYSSTGPLDFREFNGSEIDISWNIDGTTYTEASPPSDPCAGFYDSSGETFSNWIQVELEYTYPLTTPIFSAMFPSGFSLRAHDQHTILAPECP